MRTAPVIWRPVTSASGSLRAEPASYRSVDGNEDSEVIKIKIHFGPNGRVNVRLEESGEHGASKHYRYLDGYWLPNGVAVDSGSEANKMLDPRGMLSEHWKAKALFDEEYWARRTTAAGGKCGGRLHHGEWFRHTKFLVFYEENGDVPVAGSVNLKWM